jgi:electron transport complex protein RnfG
MSGQKINIPMLGAFLGVVAAIAAGLLSVVYASTAEAIQLNFQKRTSTALEQILPAFDNVPADETVTFVSEMSWPVKFYVAKKDGEIVGYAGEVVTPEGFSGDVTVMASLKIDGTVDKVIVTANTETPGLGTVITDRKIKRTIMDLINGAAEAVGLPPNTYLDQYEGRKSQGTPWKVVNDGGDVDAKTGATITSRAVCGAVYAVSAACTEHLEELAKGAE